MMNKYNKKSFPFHSFISISIFPFTVASVPMGIPQDPCDPSRSHSSAHLWRACGKSTLFIVIDKQCRAVVETIFLALKGFVLYLTDGIRCIFWFQSSSLKLFFHVYCFSVDNLSCSNISFVVCLLMSFLQKTFKNVFVSPVIFFIFFWFSSMFTM